jgi:murein DD-endopeptidase MepM/ murein hydrolase activator NlpD
VKKGEVIGYMGNTGKSTGTHLHFELRQGRSTLNPLAFL